MGCKKILVVDDDNLIRSILEQAFGRAGYTVRSASDAEQALDILAQENIKVMFIDLNLPGGMNGAELCKQIRTNHIAVIYAITGYALPSDFADCREAGFEDYFTKPVGLTILLKAAQDGFEKLDRCNK